MFEDLKREIIETQSASNQYMYMCVEHNVPLEKIMKVKRKSFNENGTLTDDEYICKTCKDKQIKIDHLEELLEKVKNIVIEKQKIIDELENSIQSKSKFSRQRKMIKKNLQNERDLFMKGLKGQLCIC